MFTKTIDKITFEDVGTFCKEWTEGVRVEYKREIDVKKHIPKIVSSFANFLGGTLIIGVVCDKQNNEVKSINGIPPENGFEERILETALSHIYPAAIPAVKIVDMPESDNIVVVVHVDESVQAPHTINNSTEVYIRSGSISRPYKLADIDRIQYMFKRREDSQVVTQQILNRIEERTQRIDCGQGVPSITLIAKPVFPYRPLISTSDIYDLQLSLYKPKRVTGGVCSIFRDGDQYEEFNEYGIAYLKSTLCSAGSKEIEYFDLKRCITSFFEGVRTFYKGCEYLGNIEVRVQLREVFDTTLKSDQLNYRGGAEARCFDSEVFVAEQCLPLDLYDTEKCKKFCENLICQLLWAYNVSKRRTTS